MAFLSSDVRDTADVAIHALSVISSLGVIGFLVKCSRTWTRLIDRVDELWYAYCTEKEIKFTPLLNKE